MKGVVFTILQQVVTDEHGEKTWDALLDAAELDGAFTAVGTYPDEDMGRLVAAASEALGITPDDVLVWFGTRAIPMFVEKYPRFFENHRSTAPFVLTLNEVIHPEVRKLFPGAYVPEFKFESEGDHLSLRYSSKRHMCSFAEGLIRGSAAHFGEQVDLKHESCQKLGDPECRISCDFQRSDVEVST